MSQPISQRDQDIIAAVEECQRLEYAVGVNRYGEEPMHEYRGGVPIPPPEDVALEVLGPDYTRREFYVLASSRALRSRGYPPDEVAELAPEIARIFEEGIADEHGEPVIDFADDAIGATD